MAVFEEFGEVVAENAGGIGKVAILVGAIALAPVTIRALRPATKEVVKFSIASSRKVRASLAGTGEQWEDLIAEARAELEATEAEVATTEEIVVTEATQRSGKKKSRRPDAADETVAENAAAAPEPA